MFTSYTKYHDTISYKALNALVAFFFMFTSVCPPLAQAQNVTVLNLPAPGAMVMTTPGFVPPLIKGITIHPENPLLFDFIVNSGEENVQGQALAVEANKMIKYFLATLTTPEEELWVNLSPYEKDRIIAEKLGQTGMGRDMLAQDYLLKQLMASLMYPEKGLGAEFWERVHKAAYERYGTTEVPVDTFNKVWIVPESVTLYEKDNSVFVVESKLKVMLEADYRAMAFDQNATAQSRAPARDQSFQRSEVRGQRADSVGADLGVHPDRNGPPQGAAPTDGMQSEIIREVLLPAIEREVNEGKTFANLRQIYNAMILATWYKLNLKESLLGQVYVNKNKIRGVDVADKQIKEKIYNQYLEAFRKGVYDYIKEDYDPATQEIIPRKYFSGGLINARKAVEKATVINGNNAGSPLTAYEQRLVSREVGSTGFFIVSANMMGLSKGGLGDFVEEAAKGQLVRVMPEAANDDTYALASSPVTNLEQGYELFNQWRGGKRKDNTLLDQTRVFFEKALREDARGSRSDPLVLAVVASAYEGHPSIADQIMAGRFMRGWQTSAINPLRSFLLEKIPGLLARTVYPTPVSLDLLKQKVKNSLEAAQEAGILSEEDRLSAVKKMEGISNGAKLVALLDDDVSRQIEVDRENQKQIAAELFFKGDRDALQKRRALGIANITSLTYQTPGDLEVVMEGVNAENEWFKITSGRAGSRIQILTINGVIQPGVSSPVSGELASSPAIDGEKVKLAEEGIHHLAGKDWGEEILRRAEVLRNAMEAPSDRKSLVKAVFQVLKIAKDYDADFWETKGAMDDITLMLRLKTDANIGRKIYELLRSIYDISVATAFFADSEMDPKGVLSQLSKKRLEGKTNFMQMRINILSNSGNWKLMEEDVHDLKEMFPNPGEDERVIQYLTMPFREWIGSIADKDQKQEVWENANRIFELLFQHVSQFLGAGNVDFKDLAIKNVQRILDLGWEKSIPLAMIDEWFSLLRDPGIRGEEIRDYVEKSIHSLGSGISDEGVKELSFLVEELGNNIEGMLMSTQIEKKQNERKEIVSDFIKRLHYVVRSKPISSTIRGTLADVDVAIMGLVESFSSGREMGPLEVKHYSTPGNDLNSVRTVLELLAYAEGVGVPLLPYVKWQGSPHGETIVQAVPQEPLDLLTMLTETSDQEMKNMKDILRRVGKAIGIAHRFNILLGNFPGQSKGRQKIASLRLPIVIMGENVYFYDFSKAVVVDSMKDLLDKYFELRDAIFDGFVGQKNIGHEEAQELVRGIDQGYVEGRGIFSRSSFESLTEFMSSKWTEFKFFHRNGDRPSVSRNYNAAWEVLLPIEIQKGLEGLVDLYALWGPEQDMDASEIVPLTFTKMDPVPPKNSRDPYFMYKALVDPSKAFKGYRITFVAVPKGFDPRNPRFREFRIWYNDFHGGKDIYFGASSPVTGDANHQDAQAMEYALKQLMAWMRQKKALTVGVPFSFIRELERNGLSLLQQNEGPLEVKLDLGMESEEWDLETFRTTPDLMEEMISGLLDKSPAFAKEVIRSLDRQRTSHVPRPTPGSTVSPPAAPGGIDFNPALLDMQIKRDGNGVPLPVWQQPITTMNIEGFLPVIINVTPITNLPMLLGVSETDEGEEGRDSLSGLGPADRKARVEIEVLI